MSPAADGLIKDLRGGFMRAGTANELVLLATLDENISNPPDCPKSSGGCGNPSSRLGIDGRFNAGIGKGLSPGKVGCGKQNWLWQTS